MISLACATPTKNFISVLLCVISPSQYRARGDFNYFVARTQYALELSNPGGISFPLLSARRCAVMLRKTDVDSHESSLARWGER